MARNVFSNLLPTSDSPSVYETLREDQQASNASDLEERAGTTAPQIHRPPVRRMSAVTWDQDVRPVQVAYQKGEEGQPSHTRILSRHASHLSSRHPSLAEPDESGDDVPMSLLIEMDDAGKALPPRPSEDNLASTASPPSKKEDDQTLRAKWQTTQTRKQLDQDIPEASYRSMSDRVRSQAPVDPREKALWRWANVENLDNFLKQVYDYYLGKGIWSITLSRILNLL